MARLQGRSYLPKSIQCTSLVFWILLLSLIVPLPLLCQPAAPETKITSQSIPADAISIAWHDAQLLHPLEARYIRYLWIPDQSMEGIRCASLVLNMVSRATTLRRPEPLKGFRGTVVRLDLRHYAPREQDLKDWLVTWEDFRFDPAFSLLITKGTLVGVSLLYPDLKVSNVKITYKDELRDVEPYVHTDGNTYQKKWFKVPQKEVKEVAIKDLQDVDVIRFPGKHLDVQQYQDLCSKLQTEAPVINSVYFANRALKTIKDDGLYSVIYGGRYYELAGIPLAGKQGTDEDALLIKLGVALDLANGVGTKELLNRLRGDRRVAVFRSGVTGGPRQMEFFRTGVGLIDKTTSLISFSHDLKQKNIDINVHPVANLLNFKDDAREVIWELPNGLHGYSAYSGAGKRQDEVPFDVANDRTIPTPHPPRLEAALSCIACHEADGSDGWKVVNNDVKKMLGLGKRLDVFGDFATFHKNKQHAFSPDTVDRLVGLYNGDPEHALQRSRDDYAKAVLGATGPWPAAAEKGQANIVKVATGELVKRCREHTYSLVTPQQALLELGINCTDAQMSLKLLNEILPPDPRADVGGVVLEDPRIAALKADIPIGRYDWDLAYSFAAERALQQRAKLLK